MGCRCIFYIQSVFSYIKYHALYTRDVAFYNMLNLKDIQYFLGEGVGFFFLFFVLHNQDETEFYKSVNSCQKNNFIKNSALCLNGPDSSGVFFPLKVRFFNPQSSNWHNENKIESF